MSDVDTARRCAEVMLANDRSANLLGISLEVTAPGEAEARMTVRDDMVNGFDVLHGGLTFALADTAFAFACNGYNDRSFAASGHIDFLRPALLGDELTARATQDHRGRRRGYYSVRVTNQRGELVALFRGRSAATGKPCIT
jgi:acyl-CoA thioesterase